MPIKKKTAPKSKTPMKKARAPKSKPKTKAPVKRRPKVGDGTSDDALRALAPHYAEAPDMPVGVAIAEFASLARLAGTVGKALTKVGITAAQIETLGRMAARLRLIETAWQRARAAVKLGGGERQKLAEAEALDRKLLAGGRWALRKDAEAQAELSRIAEGSGLADTIQDLRDLATFWAAHPAELRNTDISQKDLTRAAALADTLGSAAEKEASSLDAAAALDLRNRCFWAADELAGELREAGRYAFRLEPKVAAKFVSRYRATLNRRSRSKAKTPPTPAPASGG